MSRPTLGLYENGHDTSIAWFFDGDEGACLGQTLYADADLSTCDQDDWDHIAATLAAAKTKGVKHDHWKGYYWESHSDAKAALRACKAALKSGGKPMPDWAVKALGEGWKAPKGWRP